MFGNVFTFLSLAWLRGVVLWLLRCWSCSVCSILWLCSGALELSIMYGEVPRILHMSLLLLPVVSGGHMSFSEVRFSVSGKLEW